MLVWYQDQPQGKYFLFIPSGTRVKSKNRYYFPKICNLFSKKSSSFLGNRWRFALAYSHLAGNISILTIKNFNICAYNERIEDLWDLSVGIQLGQIAITFDIAIQELLLDWDTHLNGIFSHWNGITELHPHVFVYPSNRHTHTYCTISLHIHWSWLRENDMREIVKVIWGYL